MCYPWLKRAAFIQVPIMVTSSEVSASTVEMEAGVCFPTESKRGDNVALVETDVAKTHSRSASEPPWGNVAKVFWT